jgi:hypothetical protein
MSDSKSKGKTNTKQKGKSKKRQVTPEEMKAKYMEAEKEASTVLANLRTELEKIKPLNLQTVTLMVEEEIADVEAELTEIKEELSKLNALPPIKE